MSNLHEMIKGDHKQFKMQGRKNMDARISASILTVLIGELETATKGTKKVVTDEMILGKIKKFIDGIEATQLLTTSLSKFEALNTELVTLKGYMPKQLSAEQLKTTIQILVDMDNPNMGMVMKALKDKYNGQYDGKLASTLVKEALV